MMSFERIAYHCHLQLLSLLDSGILLSERHAPGDAGRLAERNAWSAANAHHIPDRSGRSRFRLG